MMELKQVLELIEAEYNRATAKFPYWPDDTIHAAAIVNEESGELIRASLRYRYEGGHRDEMQEEAIHTGAMAVRFLMNLP